MDVRAKQRLCYHGASLTLSCMAAVSPHVISAVRFFSVGGIGNSETGTLAAFRSLLKINLRVNQRGKKFRYRASFSTRTKVSRFQSGA